MKDMLGQDINLGDKVAYPTHDRSMKSQMVVGRLVEKKERFKQQSRWDRNTRTRIVEVVPATTVRIDTEVRSRCNNWQNNGGTTITLWNTDNLLKVS